ncbi:MAG: TasA family protein [Parcubacteria group bacterium]|jgi:predicted ribosomally synthesized peptide with SipW-like signal peptide
MKNIVKSLVLIVAVAAIAGGATYAYFTSQVKVEGMTFATGTLNVSDVSDFWMTHVSFPNLKPGDTVRKWVVLKNTGTLDIASLKVSAVNKNDPKGLLDVMTVALYGTVDGFDQGIYSPDWGNGQPVNTWLTDINILGMAVYRDATAAHVMAPDKKDTIILDFRLPASVSDPGYQGASASFDLQFDAEQSHTGATYF